MTDKQTDITMRKLTRQQIDILNLLFTYRFGTTDLFLDALEHKAVRRVIHKRLAVLHTHGYIAKRSAKGIGESAYYCLAPLGVQALKQTGGYAALALRNVRQDIRASNRFARHCVNIFADANELHKAYGSRCEFLTRCFMYGKEDWPDPLPDAYVIIKDSHDTLRHHFLLECIDDTKPQRIWKQRITRLVEYIDAGEWPEASEDGTSPALLFVCATPRLEKLVRRWTYQAYEDALAEDIFVATAIPETVAEAVLQAKSPEDL